MTYKTVHWLEENHDNTVDIVKNTFKTILSYLRHYYNKEYGYSNDAKTIEGIKTIMVLVGEAAKKLDRYTTIFKDKELGSVTRLREYKQLQDFYHKKINRQIDQGVLSKWILALAAPHVEGQKLGKGVPIGTPGIFDREVDSTHVFVDIDSVKKDAEYELLFLQKRPEADSSAPV